MRTLYFKSSGDGKSDGSLLGNGLVINWSKFTRKISYVSDFSAYHPIYFSRFLPFVFVVQVNNDFQYLK
jgi:hypothetical protein